LLVSLLNYSSEFIASIWICIVLLVTLHFNNLDQWLPFNLISERNMVQTINRRWVDLRTFSVESFSSTILPESAFRESSEFVFFIYFEFCIVNPIFVFIISISIIERFVSVSFSSIGPNLLIHIFVPISSICSYLLKWNKISSKPNINTIRTSAQLTLRVYHLQLCNFDSWSCNHRFIRTIAILSFVEVNNEV